MKKYISLTFNANNIYDCYIYKKNLYLITFDKQIIPFYWTKFIDDNTKNKDSFSFILSFYRGDVLYQKSYDLFRKNSFIRNDIINSFCSLKNNNLIFNLDDVLPTYTQKAKWFRRIDELPIEVRCYRNKLYFLQNDGVYYFEINPVSIDCKCRNVLSRSKKCIKGHFADLNFIKGNLLLAGLGDGLFISHYNDIGGFEESINISKNNASYICNNFGSFIAGSYVGESAFYKIDNSDDNSDVSLRKTLNNSESIYVSLYDKIYKISDNSIEYSIYDKDNNELHFEKIDIPYQSVTNKIISAQVSVFGIILETRYGLIVIPSDQDEEPLIVGSSKDPVINWRIYPYSKCYQNQLHVIFKNRIVVYSFYYDYFVNQRSKIVGSKHINNHIE